MPDGLSSIEGLADKHRRVLDRHHVTDLRGLVQADRRVIYRAMANLRPRPTLELISQWQDEARSMLDEFVTDTSDWHTAASFVIVFGQRHHDGAWERRVEVEQTEVEPERNPQVWPGWDCVPVVAWMTGQLAQPSDPGPPPSAEARSLLRAEAGLPAEAPSPVPAAEPGSVPPLAAVRPRLRIESATLIDAAGSTDGVKAGEPVNIQFGQQMDALPGERFWVTVVEAGAPDDKYGKYEYVPEHARQMLFEMPKDPGDYEIRLHANYPTKATNVVHRVKIHVEP